ncbi:MAG: START-like domain-containing protein [Salibacteraceae bacterium]
MTKELIELEYEIRSAPGILYNRLVTPGGLAEWFADNVKISESTYTFIWEGSEEEATLVNKKAGEFVRFHWVEDEEDDSYFEFRIKIDEMTGDVALLVLDYVDEDEVEESRNLWDKQIGKLKMILGS